MKVSKTAFLIAQESRQVWTARAFNRNFTANTQAELAEKVDGWLRHHKMVNEHDTSADTKYLED